MATTLNSYANFVLSQQAIATWTIDEDFSTSPIIDIYYLYGNTNAQYLINGTMTDAVQILPAYNSDNYPGYVKTSITKANTKPTIYGSANSTKFFNTNNGLIFPAFGFLNTLGTYRNLTLEFWTQIKKPIDNTLTKVVSSFADLANTTGLYVNNTSFVLKFGNKTGSHHFKDFNRPLLIHIVYSSENVSLMVNGEVLISLDIDGDDLALLAEPSLATAGNASSMTDYISFNDGTYDCISIFPYRVSISQAQVRFAKAHAINTIENTIGSTAGNVASVDFSSSGFSNEYKFPTNAPWNSGVSDNLTIAKNYIAVNKYALPTLNTTGTQTISDLNATGKINLKQAGWLVSNFSFDSMEILEEPIKAFYLYGRYNTTRPTSEEIIFKFVDINTADYFSISVNSGTIYYKLSYNGTLSTLKTETPADNIRLITGSPNYYYFNVGIDIDKFANNYGSNVANFFSNQSRIVVFIAGDSNLANDDTSIADILSIKFLTDDNLSRRTNPISGETIVRTDGVFYFPSGTETSGTILNGLQNVMASYEVTMFDNEIVSNSGGSWKSHIPLKNFSQTVTDVSGNVGYDFDFLQFNVGYDAPVSRTSSNLNTGRYSGFANSSLNLLTTMVRTYITFEPLSNPYQPDSTFTTIQSIPLNLTISPGAGTSWQTTKYEVADGVIVYPPTDPDLSQLCIVVHTEFQVIDTLSNYPKIQYLDLFSVAYNYYQNVTNPITTKFGGTIIPFTYTESTPNVISSRTYNYAGKNPYIISKKPSPHLYLGSSSGIRLAPGTVSGIANRGLRFPINPQATSDYKLGAIQFAAKYDAPYNTATSAYTLQSSTENVFDVASSNFNYRFSLSTVSSNSEDVVISATDLSTGLVSTNVIFYIDGIETNTFNVNTWVTISAMFPTALSLNGITGQFDLTGYLTIDNLILYQINANLAALSSSNTWQRYVPGKWQDLTGITWQDVILSVFKSNTSDAYNAYVGVTNLSNNDHVLTKLQVLDSSYLYFAGTNSFNTKQYSVANPGLSTLIGME
jgi:hypothetical protein